MPTRPRSKEICWNLIAKMEKDYSELNEAYHSLANEAQIALMKKDMLLLEKCKTCTRGVTYTGGTKR